MSSASSINSSSGAGLARCLRQLGALAQRLLGNAPGVDEPDLSGVERVVFVCTSNLHRSAFAQAVAQQAGLNAASFGLHTVTGQRTVLETVRAAAALGVRLEQHRATHCRDFVRAAGDLYLVMETRHAEELLRLGFPAQRIALLGRWTSQLRPQIPELRVLAQPQLRSCFARIQAAVAALAQALAAPGAAASTSAARVH